MGYNSTAVWDIVQLLCGVAIIVLIVFVIESMINSKISEIRKRKKIKDIEKNTFNSLQKELDKCIEELGEEILNDKDRNDE